ncbi:hypothetical protein [Desulfovibrio desulfuricans]
MSQGLLTAPCSGLAAMFAVVMFEAGMFAAAMHPAARLSAA